MSVFFALSIDDKAAANSSLETDKVGRSHVVLKVKKMQELFLYRNGPHRQTVGSV